MKILGTIPEWRAGALVSLHQTNADMARAMIKASKFGTAYWAEQKIYVQDTFATPEGRIITGNEPEEIYVAWQKIIGEGEDAFPVECSQSEATLATIRAQWISEKKES